MSEAKQSTSWVVEGFSQRKKFFSSKLAQMASTQSAPAMSATPMGWNAGDDATSPRVKSTMPAKDVFGYVANVLLLLYYAAPLSTLAKVVRQKSSASINVPLSFMSVVNGGLWSSYGLAVSDVYIWVPNVIGVVLSSVQLALCGLFKR